ncbi:hypothetical protein [Actinomadura montaniterrae]|uniref:Uncharacterized protein n=1 Tax=Actinomadura montaniterrae TaxID=1803903 RepID=A0A6L3W6V8_9ACTN|nr:hypothetical protein [Actinomadura montaniterrae]KAB2386330.1 hypothetical protein F9B16_07485 [Actinomadura montaniterrae]
MLARRFGYAVSPEPAAAATPSVLGQLDKAARMDRVHLIIFAVWGAAMAVGMIVGLRSELSFAGLVGGVLAGEAALLVVWLMARSQQRVRGPGGEGLTGPEAHRLRGILAEHPWQVWPCRVELVREHANPSTLVHVFLLDPDQNVAGVLKTTLQRATWNAMTDGYGVLWFAGDLRFGGALAHPADPADPTVSYATVAPQQPATASPGSSVLMEELQRQAIGWTFGGL